MGESRCRLNLEVVGNFIYRWSHDFTAEKSIDKVENFLLLGG